MGDVDAQITYRMRDRIRALLSEHGASDAEAQDEANSLCDGLGYYERVKARCGLRFHHAYDGIDVLDGKGQVIETIAFDRHDDRD